MDASKRISSTMRALAPLVLLMLLLAGWYATTTLGQIEQWRLPSPDAVWARATQLLSQQWMWIRIGVTAWESFLGCVVGMVVALPLAWGIHRIAVIAAAVEPFLGATQAIPAIALAPLLVLWVGNGWVPIVGLCALMVFFPILVSTVLGLRHLDRVVIEAAQLDGASGWTMLWYMEVPLAAPSMLAGLRNGFTLSVTGAVVGEMVMGGNGLAAVLVQQRNNLDTAGMFVTIMIMCVLAMSAWGLIRHVEKRQSHRNN